jgi:type II secretory pathway component PulF
MPLRRAQATTELIAVIGVIVLSIFMPIFQLSQIGSK